MPLLPDYLFRRLKSRVKPAAPSRPISGFLQSLATVVLAVFVLHAARSVIIPVALAVLATFILRPHSSHSG